MADAARSSYIQIAWKINNTGYNQLMKQFDNADHRSDTVLGRMSSHLTRVGNGMLSVGQKTKVMSAAMGGALAYGVAQSAKLENRYKVITNLLTTGGEKSSEAIRNVKRMQQQSLGISNKYGVSQQQIGKGYEELVRRGYSSNQALAAQKTFVKGAIASGDDYADVVKNSTAALEAFGLRSNKTATMTRNTNKVVNEMSYAADLTATDFKNLGYGLTYVGSTGRTADQTVGHVSAALGELSNNGQEATVAGTGLRKVYNSLAAPGPKSGVPALKSIGLSPKDLLDSKGKMKDLADIFLLLNKKMKGMTNNEKFDFFHVMFGTTGQTSGMLLAQNAKQLKSLEKQVDKAPKKNYITQLANKNMKTTLQQWKIFKQNLSNTATVMGGRLLPAANDAIESVSKLTKWFDSLDSGQKKWATYGAVAIAAFSPVMTVTGILIKNFRTLHGLVGGTWNAMSRFNGTGVLRSRARDTTPGVKATPKGRFPVSQTPNSTRLGRMQILAQQVIVNGGSGGQGGFESNRSTKAASKKIGKEAGQEASNWMYKGAPKTGRKVGNAATQYNYSKAAKIGHKTGSAINSKTSSSFRKSGTTFASKLRGAGRKAGKLGGGFFADAVDNIAWIGLADKFANDGSKVFLNGITSKKGGQAAWKLGGDTVGGAIGAYLGGPAGALIGSYIGGAIADSVEGLEKKGSNAVKKTADKTHSSRDRYYLGNGAWAEVPNNNTNEGANGVLNPSGVTKGKGLAKKKSKPKKTFRTAPKLNTGFGGHADGGLITKAGMSMVGENGFEVLQRGHSFRMIGKNGAQLFQTKPGDHIYNHSDATKMTYGTYGKRLPGYAEGTKNGAKKGASPAPKSGSTSKKFDTLSSTEKKTKRSTKKISKDITSSYSQSTYKANKTISKFGSKSRSSWGAIAKNSKRQTNSIRTNTVSNFDKMQKGSQKQMNQLHKGMNSAAKATTSDFGDIMGRLKPYAHKAMGGAITSLNGGITGINSTLSQFGGNKSVLKPIHYASGSNGPIGSDQMAVLNDATSGPRQELVTRGDQLLKPIGDDVVVPLKKGDGVLNGSQVEQAKPYLPHFAKGTGVSNSKLLSLIEKNSSKPNDAWKNDFTNHLGKATDTKLGSGVNSLSKKAANRRGIPWNAAAWNVMNDTAQSSGGAGGGAWRHNPGMAKTNGFGAARSFGSHDGNDFSGPMGSAILAMHGGKVAQIGRPGHGWPYSQLGGIIRLVSSDGYQQIYQEFGTMRNIKVAVGDVVKTGQKIATLGKLNGAGSGSHVHVGLAKGSVFDHGGSSTRGWLDITKMHGKSSGTAGMNKKASGRLEKLATNQLKTAGVLPWIAKHIAPLTEDDSGSGGTSAAPSGSHKNWLKQAGIPESWWPATNEIISAESGWNPKARNSSGAYGLPQSLPADKMASAGSDWRTNPITQLKWYKSYINSRYGGIGKAIAFRHAHGWYKSGGNPPANQPVVVGENGPELATFDSGAKIHNNRETKSLFRKSNGSPKVNVNMTVNVQGSADEKVLPKFRKVVHQELVKILTNELGNAFD